MKLNPTQLFPRLTKAASGMTLVEMMVAIAVGSLVLMFMSVVFAGSAKCFVATGNYVSMNCSSRNALDRMTREIRRAGDLTGFTTNRLQFTTFGSTNAILVYEWNANSRQLTEWQTGNAQTNILLTDCDSLAFSLYRSTLAPTSNLSEGKAIGVAWKSSRTILAKKVNTEDMQQALIVIRNKAL
jgi:prepilin-type N-terminal cleavage/methylation domain-containing protein